MAEKKTNFYPHLVVKQNEHPNKWYAVPFLGIIVKMMLLIPVLLWLVPLTFASLFFFIVTPYVILFTGKYWDTSYRFQVGFMIWYTKVSLFIAGITDNYPGFSFEPNNSFTLTVHKPETPNRWLALPVFGFMIRYILLIPYLIFTSVMSYGMQIAIFFSWFAVLFKGKYPESLHEFTVDSIRTSYASSMYMMYFSDLYPSFSISMRHQAVKILLIIGGSLILANDISTSWHNALVEHERGYQYQAEEQNTYPSTDFEYRD